MRRAVCVIGSVGLGLAVWAQEPAALPAADEPDPNYLRLHNPAFPGPEPRAVPIDRGPKFTRANLAPYFAEGKLLEARQAFDANKYDVLKAALEGVPNTPPVRFLRAWAALRALDFATAAPELDAIADSWPPLRERALILSGQAQEGLKAWDQAIARYQKVSEKSRQFPDAKLGISRVKRLVRDWPGAKDAVATLAEKPAPPWGRDVGAEALLALADLYAAKKDPKLEHEALLKLWSAHPLSAQTKKSEGRLGDTSTATTDVLVARADALIEAHRNAQGLAIVEPLLANLKLPDALACKANFVAGKGQRKQRQHAKAIATLGPVTKKCSDPETRARALYTLGFSRTVVEPSGAAATYETLVRDYPGHPYADDALFYAADVHLKQGRVELALARLMELVDRYPDGDFLAESLFRQAWVYRQSKDTATALLLLEVLEERAASNDDSYELERARYWRARILEAGEEKQRAVDLYASLVVDHPATYYGLISRERLAAADAKRAEVSAPAVAAKKTDPFPMFAGSVAKDPNFATAVELLRLGFTELVPMEILAIDRTGLTAESLRLMVHVLSLAGEERAAHGLARIWLRRDLSGPITAESRPIWEIAYPLAFREEVTKNAELADKLDPDLLQALMREESALDPKALSWAGAMGLTQLMPATAAGVAMQLKLKAPSTADLLEPDLNLRLGARYLADLIKRQKDVKQHAIASYNAGEGAVSRWRKDRPGDAIDEWVESIPLTETRGYVKRVLRSYNTYRLLYPAPPPKS